MARRLGTVSAGLVVFTMVLIVLAVTVLAASCYQCTVIHTTSSRVTGDAVEMSFPTVSGGTGQAGRRRVAARLYSSSCNNFFTGWNQEQGNSTTYTWFRTYYVGCYGYERFGNGILNTHKFGVIRDAAHNNYGVYLDGVRVDSTPSVSWTVGYPMTYTWRTYDGDYFATQFDYSNLRYRRAGTWRNWSDAGGPSCWFDNDPRYSGIRISTNANVLRLREVAGSC